MINARSETLVEKSVVQEAAQVEARHHPDGRLLRVAGEVRHGQKTQAADVHPPPRRRAAGRRRAVDHVARQDARARCAVAAQLHHHHDVGQRHDGAGPRPHAGDAARHARGTSGSTRPTTTRVAAEPAGAGARRPADDAPGVDRRSTTCATRAPSCSSAVEHASDRSCPTDSAALSRRSWSRIACAAASSSSGSTLAAALAKFSWPMSMRRDHVDVRVRHLVAGDDHADPVAGERGVLGPADAVGDGEHVRRQLRRHVDPVIDLLDRHHQRVPVGQRVDRHEHDAPIVAVHERCRGSRRR